MASVCLFYVCLYFTLSLFCFADPVPVLLSPVIRKVTLDDEATDVTMKPVNGAEGGGGGEDEDMEDGEWASLSMQRLIILRFR